MLSRMCNFYPRPPRGGRLVDVVARIVADGISIHALREEGDIYHQVKKIIHEYFYPRPPRGGRRRGSSGGRRSFRFLSTPSARRAT